MKRYRALLARREFRLLWVGATVSALGDGMSFVALVWLLLERGADAAAVGWLAAAYTAPVVVGGLVAGLLLDRFDRRRMLVLDNAVRGLAVASIPVASALGVLTTAQIFVVAAVYGLLYMITIAGIPSLLPSLVDDAELTTANAMETLTYGLGGLAGPALAGVTIALFSAVPVLAIDALSYGVFVACLLAMRPLPRATSEAAAARTVGGGGLGPAIRFVLGTPAILVITLMYMSANVGEGIVTVLLPFYARLVAGGGASEYGLLASAFAGGLIVGSVLVGALGWHWTLGRSIAAAQVVTGIVLAALLVRPPLLGAAATLAASGFAASCLTAWAQTIRMRLIPAELRGRVFALLRTAMQSTPPIGAVIGGLVLAGGSVETTIVITVAVILIPGLIGLWAPALGPRAIGEMPAEVAAEPAS
jgi:MFS family permease